MTKPRRIGADLPPPVPEPGTNRENFYAGMIDIAQTGAATSARLCWSMRLHAHRQPEFAVPPGKNSDSSPFGIYRLEARLDLIARPEDCAGKILTKRLDDRRFAASYRRIIPVTQQG
jgi:hypothetical protein